MRMMARSWWIESNSSGEVTCQGARGQRRMREGGESWNSAPKSFRLALAARKILH